MSLLQVTRRPTWHALEGEYTPSAWRGKRRAHTVLNSPTHQTNCGAKPCGRHTWGWWKHECWRDSRQQAQLAAQQLTRQGWKIGRMRNHTLQPLTLSADNHPAKASTHQHTPTATSHTGLTNPWHITLDKPPGTTQHSQRTRALPQADTARHSALTPLLVDQSGFPNSTQLAS